MYMGELKLWTCVNVWSRVQSVAEVTQVLYRVIQCQEGADRLVVSMLL